MSVGLFLEKFSCGPTLVWHHPTDQDLRENKKEEVSRLRHVCASDFGPTVTGHFLLLNTIGLHYHTGLLSPHSKRHNKPSVPENTGDPLTHWLLNLCLWEILSKIIYASPETYSAQSLDPIISPLFWQGLLYPRLASKAL